LIPLGKLKRLLFIALLVGFGCAKPINDETLIEKDGLKYHPDTKELYNLEKDPAETNNLINSGLEIEEFLWNEFLRIQMKDYAIN